MIYLHQKASQRRSRAAEFIARRASGIMEMNDAGRAQYERDLVEYRELYGEAQRARGILDQCYEGYFGDWEH